MGAASFTVSRQAKRAPRVVFGFHAVVPRGLSVDKGLQFGPQPQRDARPRAPQGPVAKDSE